MLFGNKQAMRYSQPLVLARQATLMDARPPTPQVRLEPPPRRVTRRYSAPGVVIGSGVLTTWKPNRVAHAAKLLMTTLIISAFVVAASSFASDGSFLSSKLRLWVMAS